MVKTSEASTDIIGRGLLAGEQFIVGDKGHFNKGNIIG